MNLSVELLQEICACLGPSDWKNLRAASSYLNEVTSPVLFSKLRIHLDREKPSASAVRAIATGETRIGRYVQRLDVSIKDTRVESKQSGDDLPDHGERVELESSLAPAIRNLASLRSIKWNVGQKSLKHVRLEEIWESLASLTRLEDVMLSVWSPSLPVLSHLRSLQIDFVHPVEFDPDLFLNALAAVVSSSHESLSALDLTLAESEQRWLRPSNYVSLSEFVLALTADVPPYLKSLSLKGWSVSITPITLPFFRFLTVINLRLGKHDNVLPPAVWSFLQEENVHLTELTTGDVTPSLLEYLGSYSGLATLRISPNFDVDPSTDDDILYDADWARDQESDVAAHQFYEHVLPRHSKTLNTLEISPEWEGDWCFKPSYAVPLSACIRLVSLNVCIKMDKNRFVAYDPVSNPVTVLLRVAAGLPSLRSICMAETSPTGARGAWCGNAYDNFGTVQKMRKSVVEFQPSDPELYSDLSVFVRHSTPRRMARIEDNKWRFRKPEVPVGMIRYDYDSESE